MGISCGVLVAPVLPGLSDSEEQLGEVVEACADAGAVSIHGVALHLRGTVRAHYFDWLEGARPDLVRLHRGRFRRGAYQEDAERERVEGIVRAAALRCGVTGRDRYRGRAEATGPEAERLPRAASSSGSSERGRAVRTTPAPYDRGTHVRRGMVDGAGGPPCRGRRGDAARRRRAGHPATLRARQRAQGGRGRDHRRRTRPTPSWTPRAAS